MAKIRGRGGNSNFNGGDRGNFNQGQYNNRSGYGNGNRQSFYCNTCGPNHTHNTKKCSKRGNHIGDQQSHNNKVVKKQKKGTNQNQFQGRNNYQHQGHPNTLCSQCGQHGHDIKMCNAKNLELEEPCACGCPYHYPSSCPWDHDPYTYELETGKARGKICQWCKSDGDGMHEFNECKEPARFHNQLLLMIEKSYDSLHWCWHCSGENHKTRACNRPSAALVRSKWESKINHIIDEWMAKGVSQAWNDRDNDFYMASEHEHSPPLAAKYVWCLLCECFGHDPNDNTTDPPCDRREYDIRCPPRFQNIANVPKQSFMPRGQPSASMPPPFLPSSQQSSSMATVPWTGSTMGGGEISVKCMNPTCQKNLRFPLYIPKLGHIIICPKCQYPNLHPSTPQKDPGVQIIEALGKFITPIFGGKPLLSRKKNLIGGDDEPDRCKKRPSVALSRKLWRDKLPSEQPVYDDLQRARGKEDVFNQSTEVLDESEALGLGRVTYFNRPGNAQTVFPAWRFNISKRDREIADDKSLPINKAGKLGLVYMCVVCRSEAIIFDADLDFVMCGNEDMSTMGAGVGDGVFWGPEGPSTTCMCPAFDRSMWGWVDPRG
ncbi:hypothetical protein K505DRAFT_340060 [Melanomma pulvis-pyrius CBS 109.77]|uniref:CCHC-type domain-containing protein n=1 Tax=Melanomma pulvis-pyrius CBS 109.77 TaxID=1314802 RepID=A0A6A6X3G9_9PLEO|nr:hypothetical protein K505DRAFT_340060 [Melanomma pulvis-pyrius CBS 109.77]